MDDDNINSSKLEGKKTVLREDFHLDHVFESLFDVVHDTGEIACIHIRDMSDFDTNNPFNEINSVGSSEEIDSLFHSDSKIEDIINDKNFPTSTSFENNRPNPLNQYTFAELNKRANSMARVISASLQCQSSIIIKGKQYSRRSQLIDGSNLIYENLEQMQASTAIGIYMPPGINRVIVQLACWKLNLVYFPLDRQIPAQRMLELIRSVDPIGIIISKEYFEDPIRLIDDEDDEEITNKNSDQFCNRLHGSAEVKGELMQFMSACGLLFYDALEALIQEKNIGDENIDPIKEKLFGNIYDPALIVLFSSGSTSLNPRGVCLTHKQMYNRLAWQWDPSSGPLCLSLSEGRGRKSLSCIERGLAKTAWLFVDSFTEMFSFLLNGLSIVIPGSELVSSEFFVVDVYNLSRICQKFTITRVTVVPAQLNSWLAQIRQLQEKKSHLVEEILEGLMSLNTVICSGENLSYSLASSFFKTFKIPKRLVNLYGCTEVAGDVTFVSFDSLECLNAHVEEKYSNKEEACSIIPIGVPINNTTVYIVTIEEKKNNLSRNNSMRKRASISGEAMNPPRKAEFGEVGEIAVAGDAICNLPMPYWEQPEIYQDASKRFLVRSPEKRNSPKQIDEDYESGLISSKFIDNPWKDVTRLFLTGDKGFISEKTQMLYYLGRNDDFIKVNGVHCTASYIDALISETSRQNSLYQWINNSVTIGISVKNQNKLVCFYTVKSNEGYSSNSEPHDSRKISPNGPFNSKDILGLPLSMLINCPLRPKHLITLMRNHLPIYLVPIFIQIDKIPYQLHSGKVDKFKLKEFFMSHIVTESGPRATAGMKIANLLKKNQFASFNSVDRPRAHTIIATKGVPNMRNKIRSFVYSENFPKREQARQVFALVLDLKTDSLEVSERPYDEEDFFNLGGDSLAIVRAVSELKRLHLPASVHLFGTTSRIGDLLTSLEHNICALSMMSNDSEYETETKQAKRRNGSLSEDILMSFFNSSSSSMSGSAPKSVLTLPNSSKYLSSQDFYYIEEWNADGGHSLPGRHVTRERIIEFLTKNFLEKDWITKTFNITRKTLEEVINSYLDAYIRCSGVVILARGISESLIKAIAICLPAHQIPTVKTLDKNWYKVEEFFELCSTYGQQNFDPNENVLTTIMLAVECSKDILSENRFFTNNSSAMAEENSFKGRLAIEILTVMEREIIKKAKEYGYMKVETLNTNLATKAVCAELGYQLKNTLSMKDYLETTATGTFNVSPEHKQSSGYFMTKII